MPALRYHRGRHQKKFQGLTNENPMPLISDGCGSHTAYLICVVWQTGKLAFLAPFERKSWMRHLLCSVINETTCVQLWHEIQLSSGNHR